jgi:DNA-binding NarL/FixJ family response regulator
VTPSIRILIADDHPLMRQGLHEVCAGVIGFVVVAEACNGAEAVALRRTTQPDVILMDLAMPTMDGAEAIRRILREAPASRIIVITMFAEDSYLLAAARAGARAYLRKTVEPEELIATIRAVHRGEFLIDPIVAARVMSEIYQRARDDSRSEALSEQEIEVLRLLARGLDNREIAAGLGVTAHAVSNRLRSIYQKLRLTNRTQAALYALRRGWATLDEPDP